jgi:hypothetical protein
VTHGARGGSMGAVAAYSSPFHCFSSRDWLMLLLSLDFNIFLFFNFSPFTFKFLEKNEESQQYLEKLTIKLMLG